MEHERVTQEYDTAHDPKSVGHGAPLFLFTLTSGPLHALQRWLWIFLYLEGSPKTARARHQTCVDPFARDLAHRRVSSHRCMAMHYFVWTRFIARSVHVRPNSFEC